MTQDLTPTQVQTAELQAAKEGYIHRALVAFDQFANVISDGLPDETISSRAERDSIHGSFLAKILTRGLDLIQKQHGMKAEAGDLERADTVATVETTAGTGI